MAKFKLTKNAAIAAYEELLKVVGPTNITVDKKLPDEKYYKEFQQHVIDLEVDDDDRANLSADAISVLDAIAAKYPDLEASPDEEEAPAEKSDKKEKTGKKDKKGKKEKEAPAEEKVEEATAKKGKGKKEKEEAVVVKPGKKDKKAKEVEAPAATEKKADKKGKGKKVDPAALAEQIKTDKKLGKDGCIEIIDANPELFGDNAEKLRTISNPMVLKKQMRNVLEGGEITMTETKPRTKEEKPAKGKKEKAQPTLTEQVEAIDDLDELIAFAKANKDAFPGVKAKKFDKVKKLRKALLEVVVEPKPAKSEKKAKKGKSNDEARAKRTEVIDYLTKQIEKAGGKIGRLKLTTSGLDKFPDDGKQVRDQISYGKNEKYNKFKELLVEVDGVIGFASAMKGVKPAKAEKKGKEKEVPAKVEKKGKEKAAPAKEEKKDKKSKKDKKKDKKNKKGKK